MMRDDVPPQQRLQQYIQGFQISQAIYVAAKLGIADLLKDSPRRSEDLAHATGTHPAALYRVLRLLTAVDVLVEREGHLFELTTTGAYLQSDIPGSLRYTALNYGDNVLWQVWGDLLHSVETGDSTYPHVFGLSNWEYKAKNPEKARLFDAFMTEGTQKIAPTIAAAYDFSTIDTLVDIGGGHGQMLIAILHAYPTLLGLLFDQPHVVAGAAQLVEAAGVSDRCTIMGGDAFAAVPAGYTTYLLSRIIHDWDDAQAIAILSRCYQAMQPGGKLLLVERVIRTDQMPELLVLESDVHMMVATGGKERSEAEYRELLAAAGFALTRIIPVVALYNIIEAVRVSVL